MPDLGIGEAIALASVAEVGSDAAITAGVADGLAAASAATAGAGAAEAGAAGLGAGLGAGLSGGAESASGVGAGVGAGLSDAAITAGVADSLSAAGGGVLGAGGAGALGGAAGAGASFGAGIPGIATGAPSLGATAPAGTSALGAGAVGDVGGAAGGFTLPSAAGTPGASAIGTGATEGSVSGFSSAGGIGGGSLETAPDFGFLSSQSTAELNGANPAGFASGNLSQAASPFADASTVTGPGATGTATTPSVAPSSIENFVNNPGFGTAGKAIGANANLLVPGALLGIESLMQPSMPDPAKMTRAQSGTADSLTAQGGQLLNGLNTGKLPAGAQATIDQASASAKAHIRSQYAGMGLAGSTMEQQALNQVDSQAAQQKFDMIQKLVTTGVTETQLGNQIYDSLLKSTLAEDDALSKSISNFAAASAGGGRPLIAVGA